jgi:predicted nucleotidyltransferase
VIRLFGSWARRQPHEHSDLDLAVIIDDLTRAEWREAIDEIAQIELDCEVDIGAFVTSSRRFDELLRRRRKIAMNIENEGITL